MRFPTLEAVGLTVLLLVVAACRKDVDVTPPVGSCDLLSADEMAQVKAEVKKINAASESLAAWNTWWETHGSNPFNGDVTQSAAYAWNGSSWEATDATVPAYPYTTRFHWPDGSVIVYETDGELGYAGTLTFADKTVASLERNDSGYNLSDSGSLFTFEDWLDKVSAANDEDYSTYSSSEAPYGTRFTTRAGFGEAAHIVSDDITFAFPKLSLTATFETDTKTARAEVVLNGETRRYAGQAAACEGFVKSLDDLYPDVYGLFDAGRLLNYP